MPTEYVKRVLAACVITVLSISNTANGLAGDTKEYRIGLTSVIFADGTAFVNDWRTYLTHHLQAPVKFVQRQTYREVTDLLLAGDLDAAWLCGYLYLQHRDELELLNVPLFKGKPLYHSYLIVPSSDTKTRKLTDLKKKVFAYSDPDSHSGYRYPQLSLISAGIEPKHFFAKTFFTWSHRDVVNAVADGVAQGGAVDSYVWETLAEKDPQLSRRTRVVSKSPEYGFPPLVTQRGLAQRRADNLREALMHMSSDDMGSKVLQILNLDGFTVGNDDLYNNIADSIRIVEQGG
ncbi:MAG: PhnD/SsuA/transferrin family substrate-binding protein [Candidatus Thiodiazotropha sp. (ex Epidulcina cf. delphinae)]|nr:PhnD/SsuA/transferrin family substrate-binding protein [Candidatus Thiodiazotropha sp. (ex Epidulcina cf. delphinae)]